MKRLRIELTIPGKHLSLKEMKGPEGGKAPDLVCDLRCRNGAMPKFRELFPASGIKTFDAFTCVISGDTASFYLSEKYISELLAEISVSEADPGSTDQFSELSKSTRINVSMSSKKDFYVYYALLRAGAAEKKMKLQGEAEADAEAEAEGPAAARASEGSLALPDKRRAEEQLEAFLTNNGTARILAAVLASGLGSFYSYCEAAACDRGNETFDFCVKSGNFAPLAAKLLYICEKTSGGELPAPLAVCVGKYVRRGVTEEPYEDI